MPHAERAPDRADERTQQVLDGITWCRYVCTIAEPHCGCREHLATALREHAREERARAVETCAKFVDGQTYVGSAKTKTRLRVIAAGIHTLEAGRGD